ncbi:hypothetical protein [Ruficoccus sp. ZRK36]|uniref:hypothetical protein n=1 Tax=Ruficoccus sp. ZRK36 TaxID=2866311 RepID=UPI001C735B78|nr:hypothetical protein [Ruficoccus sp. ZRK36]QYY35297.1 hypothetical protein K0V07_13475 [Ruficoccus sp. ZRK36]
MNPPPHRPPTQPDLLSLEQGGESFFARKEPGNYTAERLERQEPRTFEQIITMLAEGRSFTAIRRATGSHFYTIKAVHKAAAERGLIEPEKERLAGLAQLGARLGAEAVIEAAQEGRLAVENWSDAQRAATVTGILTEKSELLSGGATQRVEHAGEVSVVDVRKALEQDGYLGAGPVIDAETLDSPPPEKTGLAGTARGTKEGLPGPTGDFVELPAQPDPTPTPTAPDQAQEGSE